MKPTLIFTLTTFLSALLLSASLAPARDTDQSENNSWWSGWRNCPPAAAMPAQAGDEATKAEARAEKNEQDSQANSEDGKQVKVEARAIQSDVQEEVEEEDADAKPRAKAARNDTVEIEITIRIGSTERTVKLEVPIDEFQVPVIKARAVKKAKLEVDQTTAAADAPAKPVVAEVQVDQAVKAADEQKTVTVDEQVKAVETEVPVKQEIKAADDQKTVAVDDQKAVAADEQAKAKAATEAREADESDPVLKDVSSMLRQIMPELSSPKIDPAFWEKREIPPLPVAREHLRSTLADAFSGMQGMLNTMWQDTKAFVAALGKLSTVADSDAQVRRHPE